MAGPVGEPIPLILTDASIKINDTELACIAERIVALVLGRMRADTYTWPLDTVSAPRQTDQSGVSSLVAEVVYAVPTTI